MCSRGVTCSVANMVECFFLLVSVCRYGRSIRRPDTTRPDATRHDVTRRHTTRHDPAQHDAKRHSATQRSAAQRSAAQRIAAQRSAAQRSETRRSAMQRGANATRTHPRLRTSLPSVHRVEKKSAIQIAVYRLCKGLCISLLFCNCNKFCRDICVEC